MNWDKLAWSKAVTNAQAIACGAKDRDTIRDTSQQIPDIRERYAIVSAYMNNQTDEEWSRMLRRLAQQVMPTDIPTCDGD